eukprot:768777-Hanusia_phi.AAC.3
MLEAVHVGRMEMGLKGRRLGREGVRKDKGVLVGLIWDEISFAEIRERMLGFGRDFGTLHALFAPSTVEKEISTHLTTHKFTEEQIKARVKELGEGERAYGTENSSSLGLPFDRNLETIYRLKATFDCHLHVEAIHGCDLIDDLIRSLQVDHIWEFMSFSSYGSGTTSSGAVQLVLDLKMDIKGRDVLVIEDILDTGNTLRYMLKQLNAREPHSIKTCFEMTLPDITAEYIGWKIPNKFVVGYGLDYAQKYRGLPWIGVVAPWVYTKNKECKDDGSLNNGDVSLP